MHAVGVLAASSGSGFFGGFFILLYIAWIVLIIAGWWKMFTKAGEAGWQSIIPIWNIIVVLKIIGRPWWWIILLLIPCVGFVIWILIMLDLAKSFAKGVGFAIGLIILQPIFAIILGFGDARYVGPATQQAA
jgi:Family of unknown function (DUF5684)